AIRICSDISIFIDSITPLIPATAALIISEIADEWPGIQQTLLKINNWIRAFAETEAAAIAASLKDLEAITDTIIDSFETQVSSIEKVVDEAYDARQGVIYGAIAEFGVALGVSADYLENVIQNARSFAMGVSVQAGVTWYDFEDNWQKGIDNLLLFIRNNVSLFRENPRYIKTIIDQTLIKPVFVIEADRLQKQRQVITETVSRLAELKDYTVKIPPILDDLNYKVDNLYTDQVLPAVRLVSEAFEAWQKDVYKNDFKLTSLFIDNLYLAMNLASARINGVLDSLNYGGDILLRIDGLSGDVRIEQEEKIADVSTRRFKAIVPGW
ncbi:unnamed protein product, partial [marine sediment metagenome]